MLYDLYLYRDRGIEACDIRIENNPKLEFSCDGGFLHMYNELIVRGNLKDCGEKQFFNSIKIVKFQDVMVKKLMYQMLRSTPNAKL